MNEGKITSLPGGNSSAAKTSISPDVQFETATAFFAPVYWRAVVSKA